jgi:hypothetical protein
MLTGIGLILFVWTQMVLVASVKLGSGVMNAIPPRRGGNRRTNQASLMIHLPFFKALLYFSSRVTCRKSSLRV